MMRKDEAEEARIIALRAERVRIAARERAARLEQSSVDSGTGTDSNVVNADTVARFIRSVPPPADPTPVAADTPETPAPSPVAETPAEAFLKAVPPSPLRTARRKTPRSLFAQALSSRLFVGVVVIPMVLIGLYLTFVATPLHEAQSVIAITRSSEAEGANGAGLLGKFDGASDLQEVFRANTFINSQALMDLLEVEHGLVTEFSGPAIDPVRRLWTLPGLSITPEDQFDRFVESSIDLQSGLITVYVRSPREEHAIDVSNSILRLTDEQVARLAQSMFETRQSYAAEIRADAEAQAQRAQSRLLALQLEHQEVDPNTRVQAIYARIQELQSESQRLKGEIQKLEIDGFGDSPPTRRMIALEAAIQQEIQREREQLVSADGTSVTPLNNLVLEYEKALLEVDLAREAVKFAIEAEAEAGREAALSRSHLQIVVPPSTVGAPVYPKVPAIMAFWLIVLLAVFAAARSVLRRTT